jgi:hypothetical protein
MLLPIHAEQARRQSPLSRILRASKREELRMKSVAVGENLPVEIRADRNDNLLPVLLQSDQVSGLLLKPTHARNWVVREIAQLSVDRGECLRSWLESGHERPDVSSRSFATEFTKDTELF